MAISQCLKCGNRFFESVVKIPIGSPRRVMFVQCSVCGGVVGVQEAHGQNSKKDPEQVELMREPAHSPFKAQAIVPSDINTVLKQLYG
jgi:hypothetical protein